MDAPREVKIAIALSWIVLAMDSGDAFWKILEDPQASKDVLFKSLWIAVTIAAAALTALFIYQASRRRNWGRIALLVWTVGSWSLWFLWPQKIAGYPWWKWAPSAALIVMELAALVLLFLGSGARWYASTSGGTDAL
jgi:hypothetical protein